MKEISLCEAAIHSLSQSIAVIGPDGIVLAVNHNWAKRACQYDQTPLWDRPGINVIEYFRSAGRDDPESRQLLQHILQILDGTCDYYAMEIRAVGPQEINWFLAEISPLGKTRNTPAQGMVVSCTDITRLKEREQHMEQALSHVNALRGLLPICAVCKKIKDENEIWNSIEAYLQKHAHAEFTHDICPDCIRVLYPKYSSILERQDDT